MKFFLMCIFAGVVLFSQAAVAQIKPGQQRKLSPGLQKELTIRGNTKQKLLVSTSDITGLKNLLQKKGLGKTIIEERPEYRILVLDISFQQLDSLAAPSSLFDFVDLVRQPREETIIDGFDRTANQLNRVYATFPGYNGEGIHISVKEQRPDSLDKDFQGRYIPSVLSAPRITTHATRMATIAAGAGNTSEESRGAAWGSLLSSSDFENLLPDPFRILEDQQILVQNHSYGTGIENYYGADAAAYDSLSWLIPGLLNVFSAGNSGMETPPSGQYAGIAQVANLTGSFKMAKNIITVGSTDSLFRVPLSSSKGPAYDGRLKPELVAFGEDGSSGAAAVVSGIAAVLQQQYASLHNGKEAPSPLIKAILLNTASDLGSRGIDFTSGFGMANAYEAVRALESGSFFMGEIGNMHTDSFRISVTDVSILNVLLCWNDLPAAVNAEKALVNDLDLYVRDPQGRIYYPWVLSSFPNPDSLQQAAFRGQDTLNPVEQVSIDLPANGEYTLFIRGRSLVKQQSYAVTFFTKPSDFFEWNYPVSGDKLKAGAENLLRWNSSLAGPAELEYSLDGGSSWNSATGINLETGYIRWTAPDTLASAMLRIRHNQQEWISDKFSISIRPELQVGYICGNSIMFYWEPAPADSFRLFSLEKKFLVPLQVLEDTIFQTALPLPSGFLSVAPVIDNLEGRRSYMIDYRMQGAGCFVNSFLADLLGREGRVSFSLGTTKDVERIMLEKFIAGNWQELYRVENPTALFYQYFDSGLYRGNNQYRLRLMVNGQPDLVTGIESFFYFADDAVVVYPNPARAGAGIMVASSDPEGLLFELFDELGRKILERKLFELVEHIPGAPKSGIYFYTVKRNNRVEASGKIIIQ